MPVKYYREWSELFVAGLPLLEEAPREVRDAARPDSAQAAARMLGLSLGAGGATAGADAAAPAGAGVGTAGDSAGRPDAERPLDKDGLLDEADFSEYKARSRLHTLWGLYENEYSTRYSTLLHTRISFIRVNAHALMLVEYAGRLDHSARLEGAGPAARRPGARLHHTQAERARLSASCMLHC